MAGVRIDREEGVVINVRCALFTCIGLRSLHQTHSLHPSSIRSFKMRSFLLLAAAVPFAQAVRIVQSNDDGWSEANLRTFFDVLNSAGHEVVLSGPAENQSGRGW